MSMGGLIGAVVGGVIGWFLGGPVGMLYGAGLGFGLGMMVDPMTPDVPSPGAPLPAAAEIMDSTIGGPLPDLVGTAKITGHLLCYGKERTVTLMEEPEGGKGGGSDPDPYVTGYEYYMSWAVGIAVGPIDTLYAIYKGDDLVWEGELNIPIDPDSHGQETIVLTGETPQSSIPIFDLPFGDPIELPSLAPGMGTAIFYFGTDNQVSNSNVGDIIGDDTLNSPYRNFCWCFFDDCYIGKFNRCPTMKFVVRKSPEIAFSADNVIQTYDYNPIHTIWYILHNLAELPEEWLHINDFAIAASTIADETRGICCLFENQQSALNYLESITNHIDGIIRYGSDGKFHPKLIRDDYVVDDLPLIDENVMLDDPTLKRKSWVDTVNEVKAQYTEIIGYGPFPQGPWKAAMFSPESSLIYVYDITYKSVVKLSTSVLPPVCQDALVITEYDLDYDMGYGNPGAQRGGYCMNPDSTRLWYLVRDGLDCNLIEVDISDYYMEIISTTVLSSLLAVGEKISDGCSDGTYTYWSTTLVAGRVIKIRNSDHSIVLDTTFNYPIVGLGGHDSCIESLIVEGSHLYWIYSRDHTGCVPEYNACSHWVKSDKDFIQDLDVIYCGSIGLSPYEQNLIRYIDGNMFVHRGYHPFCGELTLTNKMFGPGVSGCKYYVQNMLGVEDSALFILTYRASYTTYLKCVALSDLGDLSSEDVSEYTGHPYDDGYTWLSTSAMSDYGIMKVISLFRYDEAMEANIVTCFAASELLTKLCENYIPNKVRISYGS